MGTLEESVESYRGLESHYAALAQDVARVLNSFPEAGVKIHNVVHRAKSHDSFKEKCAKLSNDGAQKYDDPLTQITDLAGVRVIVFVPSSVDEVCEFIEENFDVSEHRDVGEERFATGNFGYKSIHLLATMKKERTALPEFRHHRGLVCEIQVRTVLQHAWAEMEHDIRYGDYPIDTSMPNP